MKDPINDSIRALWKSLDWKGRRNVFGVFYSGYWIELFLHWLCCKLKQWED